MTAKSLTTHPIHLGLGATAEAQPEFPRDERAMQWYEDYGARHATDGNEARLMAMWKFTENWPMWEMHPNGTETVLCTAGEIMLTQEHPDGKVETVTLQAGEYAINPPGVWHTADIAETATCVFVTAGVGTRHRPR